MESKRQLSGADEAEIKSLWKKLVKLFHPDRVVEKQIAGINVEVAELKSQAKKLANEIRKLTGADAVRIG